MFNKIFTVAVCLLTGTGAFCVYGIVRGARDQQHAFRTRVEELHRDVRNYHLDSEPQAQIVAAILASPYYLKLREYECSLTPFMWRGEDALWNHIAVIREVTLSTPEFQSAPTEKVLDHFRNQTPIYILSDLRTAHEELKDLLARFHNDGVQNEKDLAAIQTLFTQRQRQMDAALAAAENWP